MMKTKIATDLEQSKRLLELGLDTKTADMYYHVFSTEVPICEPFDGQDLQIPCWSLSALLSLMPYTIELCDESPTYILGIYRNSDGYAIDYWNSMNGNRAALYKGSELLDAAVEMVEWLLENKYIIK